MFFYEKFKTHLVLLKISYKPGRETSLKLKSDKNPHLRSPTETDQILSFEMTAMASPEAPTNADESTEMSNLLPLASAAQQPYVSELLSFTLDRLHKVLLQSYID